MGHAVFSFPWKGSKRFVALSNGSYQRKRALNIIYPEAESYAHALQLGKLDRLDDRRVLLCYKYMAKMKSPSHPLHHLLPSPLLDAPNYTLRQKTQKYYLFRNMQVCRTKRVEDFFTFNFFK